MTNRQENKLSMYNVTLKVLDKNSTQVGTIPALATAAGNLKSAVKLIRDTNLEQAKTTVGKTMDKRVSKEQLAAKTYLVAAAVQAYAATIADNDLFELVNFPVSELEAMEDELLQQVCRLVLNTANDQVANLGDFGVDTGVLNALEVLIEAWDTESQTPRIAISERSAATQELPDLFKQVDDILKKQTDKLMEQFKGSDQVFFDTYKNARKIVNAGHGHTTVTVTGKVVDAVSVLGIANAMVENVDVGLVVSTDANGVFELPKVPLGEVELLVTAVGYVPKELTVEVETNMNALEIPLQPE